MTDRRELPKPPFIINEPLTGPPVILVLLYMIQSRAIEVILQLEEQI